jgi:hypothetical protein
MNWDFGVNAFFGAGLLELCVLDVCPPCLGSPSRTWRNLSIAYFRRSHRSTGLRTRFATGRGRFVFWHAARTASSPLTTTISRFSSSAQPSSAFTLIAFGNSASVLLDRRELRVVHFWRATGSILASAEGADNAAAALQAFRLSTERPSPGLQRDSLLVNGDGQAPPARPACRWGAAAAQLFRPPTTQLIAAGIFRRVFCDSLPRRYRSVPPSTPHPCQLPANARGHNLHWVMAMPSAHSIGLEMLPIDGEDLARPERFGGHDE